VVAGLTAIAALLVRFDGGAKRLVVVGHVAPAVPVAQPLSQPLPPPSPPAALPRAAPERKPAARDRTSVPSVAFGDAAGARDSQPTRSRRHHHDPSPDEDATLPPTPELSGEGVGDSVGAPPDVPAQPNGNRGPGSAPLLP